MNKGKQFKPVIIGVLVALVSTTGKAIAARCGSTASEERVPRQGAEG